MANDFGALGSALYTLLDNASTAPVYNLVAPQGTVWPYVVFQRQDAQDEHTFDSAGVNADYVVKVVGKDQFPTALERMYDGIHAVIDGAGMPVTGYNLLRMERQTTIEYRDTDMFWHVGGLYRVEIWEA